MPNCDFYAAGEDLTQVLDFVFSVGDCRVFESYSPFDEELAEFNSTTAVRSRYPLGHCTGNAPSVLLSLWLVRASAEVRPHRVSLDSTKCNGATFRFTLEGWGLIALQLGGESPNGLVVSHTNHNSEARARKWASTYEDTLGDVSSWDWREVSRVSTRLNRYIRARLAVSKIDNRVVLPQAARLIAEGAEVV